MTSLRNASIRVAALVTAYTTRGDRDRGEGPLSYIAVALLIAAIAVAVAGSGVGGTIVSQIQSAVSNIFTRGNSAISS
ncbi:hypothetical protein [Actinomadura keratinilytica]|jgi:hypothetical protein|uniref:Flp family type IVb pilin n=1 Tax=Actinomadura keratinilytica TaxID=547461 RepID=A0ABP7Y9J6_9ACTN